MHSVETSARRYFDHQGFDRINTIDAAGAWWLTNGQVLLRLPGDPQEQHPFKVAMLATVSEDIERMLSSIGEPCPPAAPYIDVDGKICRDIGTGRFVGDYVALIESLYPGCAWRAPVGHPAPAFAVIGARVVALLMPTSQPAAS